MSQGRVRPAQAGFSMIEVLIAIIIIAFGLLGLASFVTRATAASVDASQRVRAAALLSDMSARLNNNKAAAASYAGNTVHGAAPLPNCAGIANLAARDLCEWNNLLLGAQEAVGTGAGAPALTFRGCVAQPNPADPVFVITVTWASNLPGVPPAETCGAGAFGEDESVRRVLRTVVRVAALTA